ncbi:hypothetical protein O9G_006252 [Rozella allomycis CSF55]|uniref:Retrovirus-related Pol polyprotein from transposon TNT 1-94-like beta-barrel domain-containing protein n=1 Tax=Rozella allomycis (strain CSF55) TaxID=988480 RepID=A0A075B4N0_ROZAC|nr:hypothetical protein O9G_006252 [Rozella allomycis CSF55]|eukprot:EPZ36483.1 hypothetical protein O9G_006252 [Rozella allomycis CSF55]
MKIEGSGEIPRRVKNSKGEIKEVRLYNVLHVPSMNSNLLSIPKLLKNPEITVVMEQDICSVRRRECEIMRARRRMKWTYGVDDWDMCANHT